MKNWYKQAEESESGIEDLRKVIRDDEETKKPEDIDEIPTENQGGDCYVVSGRYMMDHGLLAGESDLILVHGEVTGQGHIDGVKYGHAWIEDGEMVLDLSGGRNIKLPKFLYYSLGNIDESKVFKYNSEDMRRKILDMGHWGPWDMKTRY